MKKLSFLFILIGTFTLNHAMTKLPFFEIRYNPYDTLHTVKSLSSFYKERRKARELWARYLRIIMTYPPQELVFLEEEEESRNYHQIILQELKKKQLETEAHLVKLGQEMHQLQKELKKLTTKYDEEYFKICTQLLS